MTGMFFLKFVSAFVLVIALMLLLAWFIKRVGLANGGISGNVKRRLKVVEFLPIDHRRRLVLIKRDNKEHLILLSSSGETVVETGISVDNLKDINNAKD